MSKQLQGIFMGVRLLVVILCLPIITMAQTTVFINEIHYDNDGTDANEAVEIAGPAGTDLTNWSLVFYNGNGGASYNTLNLMGIIDDEGLGFGALSFSQAGIQNGAPDGVALVNNSTVIQFLSYEGTFAATDGPANGMMSEDIGVSEGGSTLSTESLQLIGMGSVAEDFDWSGPSAASMGDLNSGQMFPVPAIRIIAMDPSNDNITLKNFGVADEDISNYNLCAGPGNYQALSAATLITGDLLLSGGEEVTIQYTQSDLTTTEGLGLFIDASDFNSDSPEKLLDYLQWGAANQDRVDQAVTAGRWDDADNFITGTSPFIFGGFGDDFGSLFWISGASMSINFDTDDLVEASLDGAEIEVTFNNDLFVDGIFDLNNFSINNAPAGLTIDKVELDGDVSAGIITLAYNGGQLDNNITGITFSIDGSEIYSGGNATSDPFEIQAVAEENVSKSFVNTLEGQILGTFETNVFDESAAEIGAYDVGTSRLFFTDANSGTLRVLDISDPTNPVEVGSGIALAGAPNSVTVNSTLGLAAVSVEGATFDANGFVQFFDTQTLAQVGSNVTVGVLPDMVTFTPDGSKVIVANEGEPNDDYTVDPEGSVSVITIPMDPANLDNDDVVQISLTSFNAQEATLKAEGVRIFGPGASVAEDLEPEFVAVTPDNTTAYVSCQENNALLVVDLGTNTVTDILPLGTKDHNVPGNGLDLSNRDGVINIARWPVKGMYQPDALAIYNDGTNNFVVSANEGDAREYEGTPGFVELERIKDLDLDDTVFPNEEALLQDAAIGRLEVTNTLGDIGGDNDFDELYSYGARSFSIWDASGNQIWDSGNQLEVLVRDRNPEIFNTTNDENAFDNRSDDAGPEPEGVILGEIDGRTYAFIGLERISSIAIYDITDETAPVFAGYLSNRNPEASDEAIAMGNGGDLGPEGLVFIPAGDSPNGENLLVVTNEVSGSVTVWQIGEVPPPAGPITAFNENFDDTCPTLPGGWSEFHTGADLIACDEDNTYINFDGFSNGAGTSYLLSPRVDLSDDGYVMNFDYVSRFSGPAPEVLYSLDYPGTGDPAGFTFTNLVEASDILTNDQTANNDFVNSGPIDLTGITGGDVTFAIKYTSNGTGGGNSIRLRIDRFEVAQPAQLISEMFDDTCPNLPAGFVEWNEGLDLISCGDDEYIDFNGFGVGAGVSWLITPAVDLTFEEIFLSFKYVNQFGGPDPEILYSIDYAGSGDPNLATFTNITAAEDIVKVQTDGAFLPTGEIDLSFIDDVAYIAFKYTSLGDGGGQSLRYRIDDLVIARPVSTPPAGMKTIAEIQGTGATSPFDGAQVMTEGIVTAIFDGNEPFSGAGYNANLGGFYMQDVTADGDDMTSDGIFVEASQQDLGVFVTVGDIVSLNGVIVEKFGQTALTDVTDVEVISSGNMLPPPAAIDFPVASVEDLERYEGMLISVVDELTVRENRSLNNNGEIFLAEGGRVFQPTQIIDPNDGSPEGNNIEGISNIGAIEDELEKIAQRSIVLDDGRIGSSLLPIPYLNPMDNSLRAGTTVNNLSGVLSFDFDAYRIQPTEAPSFTYAPRPSVPDIGVHRLKVVSFNVLNYFNGDGLGGGFPTSRGAGTFTEFEKQTDKIVDAIATLDGDVVGLVEIENEDDDGNSALEQLVQALNDQMGAGTYDFINTGTVRRGDDSADEIRVAIIYKPATVSPLGNFAILNNDFDENYKDDKNRPAVAQSFEEIGTEEVFTVVVNHFKSKGSGCGDDDDDDFQGNCNGTRTDAALVQSEWLTTDPTKVMDPDFLVIGDINAYAQEDPMDAFRSTGFRLINTEPDDTWSFIFDGLSGSLDHILATPSISVQVSGAGTWHINADEPDFLEYDGVESLFAPDAFRSSDHDPLILGLNLDGTIPPPVGDAQNTIVVQIANDTDDAEEYFGAPENDSFRPDGSMDIESSDIELGYEEIDPLRNQQVSGFRFVDLGIPKRAKIISASIQFTVDETGKNLDPANFVISAEDSPNPATFAPTDFNITTRDRLITTIPWTVEPGSWDMEGEAGPDERTPNIAALVQELVNQEDWIPGNAMAFFIEGTGSRTAESYNTNPAQSAALRITYIPTSNLEIQIASGVDDAEEYFFGPNNDSFRPEGSVDLTSSDIELGNEEPGKNPQISGLRFTNVNLPKRASIVSAAIQFTVDENGKNEDPAVFQIKAEDSVNPAAFSESDFDITSRTFTNSIEWTVEPGSWNVVGAAGPAERTTDISSLVQELVNKEDWNPGNPMAFFLEGTGIRVAESFEGSPADAARLLVEFVPTEEVGVRIASGIDDAEEYFGAPENDSFRPDGSMDVGSSDIELGYEANNPLRNRQVSGLRFINLDIPREAVIESASIQFKVDNTNKNLDPANYTITAEDNVSPAAFTETDFDITNRTTLSTSVDWNVPGGSWGTIGEAGPAQETSDISALLQELVNKEDWTPGSAVAFFIEGEGIREAAAFDSDPEGAALLKFNFLKAGAKTEVPELIAEIPDVETREGFSFEVDLRSYFVDRDSKLFYSATAFNGAPLPAEITLDDEQGVLRGSLDEPTYLTVVAKASSFGEEATAQFNIIVEPSPDRVLEQISTVQIGAAFDEGAAEISAFDSSTDRLFVTNSESDRIEIIDFSDPSSPVVLSPIDISTLGGGINSVAVDNGVLAAAIENNDAQMPGKVYLFNTSDATQIANYDVGALPDMVTFDESGDYILVANEGEPNDDYTVDPEGSVSVIDISAGAGSGTVATATFTSFNGMEATLEADGARIFGPGASVAQDLEPEFITTQGGTAYVTLQENNAIAIVDIATATVTAIEGLGFKDHSLDGNGIDVPDTPEEEIFINNRLPFKGMYQPDAIASYVANTNTYLVTANEGDAREYGFDTDIEADCTNAGGDFDAGDGPGDGFCLIYTDETKIEDISFDGAFFGEVVLDLQELAGDLKITNTSAQNGSGEYQELLTFGSRSFSIWDANGNQVFDSGDDFEQITASLFPENFNASNSNNSLKNRSDDKGPEPEAVTIGEVGGVTYAFIGLERIGGIMVYDVTDPNNPEFIEYVNNRDFSQDAEDDFLTHGDTGPEGLVFIPAMESPNNVALLVVSNEVSGTVTTYTIGEAVNPFTLSVFHNNDGESDVLPNEIVINGEEVMGGGAGQFVKTLNDRRMEVAAAGGESITLSSGDNFLPGPEFDAGVADDTFYDAVLLDIIDYDAIALGNHDFDFGPTTLSEFINEFSTNLAPYVSANLDFSNVPELNALVMADRIVTSTIVNKGGEDIGIVGLTTTDLDVISSPGATLILDNLAEIAQAEIDDLTNAGINKVILISHLQGLTEDRALASELTDVDIVIAGGGDELLSNNPNIGLPYNINPIEGYPIIEQDADGKDVYIVTTPGQYRFLGNLTVDFDGDGNVIEVVNGSDIILVTGDADPAVVTAVEDPVAQFLEESATTVIATTEIDLDFRREELRKRETNGGNLFADALLWESLRRFNEFSVNEPDIAIQNSGGLRLEDILPAGGITDLDTRDIASFTNILSVMEDVTAQQLKTIIEWGVAEAPELDGRFPQIAGFEVRYDQSREPVVIEGGAITSPGKKVISIKLEDGTDLVANGRALEGAPTVNLASIDFTLNGGDAYPFEILGLTEFTTVASTYQQAFKNYLVESEGLNGLVEAADYPLTTTAERNIPTTANEVNLGVTASTTPPVMEGDDTAVAVPAGGGIFVSVAEGGTLTVSVSTSVPVVGNTDFALTITGATTDVTITSSQVTIAEGTTSASTTIEVPADILDETDETLNISLLSLPDELMVFGTSEATVTITDRPVVAAALIDRAASVGFAPISIPLTGVFTDANNDALTISATSSNTALATVAIDQNQLVITGVSGTGTTTITVTASDGKGGVVSDEFTLTVSAPGLSVTVTDADNNAIIDGTAILHQKVTGGFEEISQITIDATTGNSFTFSGLAPGDYAMEIVPGPSIVDNFFTTYSGNKPSLGEAVLTTVNSAQAITIVMIAKPVQQGNGGDGVVSGTLTDPEATGRQTQTALSGVDVFLLDENGNIVGFDTTDSNGEFSFSGLLPGNYTLSVDYEGLAIEGAAVIVGSGGEPVMLELEVSGDTIVSTVVETTGLGDELTELIIYPNPFTTQVYLENIAIDRIEVKNVSGQRLRSLEFGGSTKVQLDLSDLNQGVYFLEIVDQTGGLVLKRILKN